VAERRWFIVQWNANLEIPSCEARYLYGQRESAACFLEVAFSWDFWWIAWVCVRYKSRQSPSQNLTFYWRICQEFIELINKTGHPSDRICWGGGSRFRGHFFWRRKVKG
jgi:hypothetical protein